MKRIAFFLCFLCFCLSGGAQSFHKKEMPSYEFIVDTMNRIQYFGMDTMRKHCFFEKLDSLMISRKGRINILHIGGSHVQADIFSNEVRLCLDSVNKDLKPGRGYIFPYEVAKTNNPFNYKVSHKGEWIPSRNVKKDRVARLGLGGIAVTTRDPSAEISVWLNDKNTHKRWKFNRLRLLGYADTSTVVPLLKKGESSYLEAVYDSVSSSYLFDMGEMVDSFTLVFAQRDTLLRTFTVTGFIPENEEQGVVYHSVGVNGAAVPSYLSCPDFERDLALIHPDLIIFGIGINDAVPVNFSDSTFVAHYDSLLAKIEKVVPECLYIFITNNDSYRRVGPKRKSRYEVNKNGPVAQKAFYTLARKHSGGVWDMFALMGGLKSMGEWEQAGLARKDKVHFTNKGYVLMGDMFFNAFMEAYIKKENRRK